jgi:hypothetical protein
LRIATASTRRLLTCGDQSGAFGFLLLAYASQYREKTVSKIFVHLIDRLVHRPGEMLIHLPPRDGERLLYRTLAVEKYDVTERILGIIAALLRIRLQQDLYAKRVVEHLALFAPVMLSEAAFNFIRT